MKGFFVCMFVGETERNHLTLMARTRLMGLFVCLPYFVVECQASAGKSLFHYHINGSSQGLG